MVIFSTWLPQDVADVIDILSVRTLSLLGLSSPCSLMSNLAALGLNPSPMYISCSHKAIISGTHALCTHRIPMYNSQGIIPWYKSHFWASPFSHILHQYLLPFVPEQLAQIWVLTIIDYIWIVGCYVSTFYHIYLPLLLRVIKVCFRLVLAFWLRPSCWVSPNGPRHLGPGQTITAINNMSCYHHCNDCTSWWRASVPTEKQ